MYLFFITAMLIVMIVLIFFTVAISFKLCAFLDGLAKKADGEDIFKKPNRTKVRATIRNKLHQRIERFSRKER